MDKRKETILNTIIKEHIKTGAPVGSSALVEKYKINISPATARNEMSDLEDKGYIVQPHTSAGRVPTEKAYKFYLEKIGLPERGKKGRIEKINLSDLEKALANKNEQSFKEASKIIATLSENAVFWAFHRHDLYYTGISNLFNQPEFSQLEVIHDISEVIDHIDEIIDRIFENAKDGVQVLIGSENPFGNLCATIMVKYRLNDHSGLLGLIGPMRMNYERNIAIAEFVNDKLRKKE